MSAPQVDFGDMSTWEGDTISWGFRELPFLVRKKIHPGNGEVVEFLCIIWKVVFIKSSFESFDENNWKLMVENVIWNEIIQLNGMDVWDLRNGMFLVWTFGLVGFLLIKSEPIQRLWQWAAYLTDDLYKSRSFVLCLLDVFLVVWICFEFQDTSISEAEESSKKTQTLTTFVFLSQSFWRWSGGLGVSVFGIRSVTSSICHVCIYHVFNLGRLGESCWTIVTIISVISNEELPSLAKGGSLVPMHGSTRNATIRNQVFFVAPNSKAPPLKMYFS